MDLALVQITAKVQGTTLTIPFSTPPSVGNAIVVPVVGRATTINFPPTACTDNYGNTYLLATTQVQTIGADCGAAIYYCNAVQTTGASFTVTIPNLYAMVGCGIEVNNALILDQIKTAISGATSTTPATGATAPLMAAEEFVVAAYQGNSSQASIIVESVSPAWIEAYETLSGFGPGEAVTRILTNASGTTTSASWTLASAESWVAILATFKVGAAPVGPTSQGSSTTSVPSGVPTQIEQNVIYALPARASLITTSAPCEIGQTLTGPWTAITTPFVAGSFIRCTSGSALVTCKARRR